MGRWPVVRLGEIAKIVSGGTPSRANPTFWGGDIPWIKTAEIRNGVIGAHDIDEYITESGLGQSSARIVPAGTILMAMYGQGGTRGRVSVLSLDAAINQACAAVLLRDGVDRDYVFQTLRFHYERIRRMSNAGSQDNLSADILRSITIPLPPLDEQRRIAQSLATWDSAIEATERLIRLKRSEILGVVKAAAISREGARTVRIGNICDISKGSGLSKKDLSPTGSRPCILYGELHTTYREVAGQVLSRTYVTKAVHSKSGDVLIPSSSETREDLANATALSQDGVLLGGDINILRPKAQGEYDAEYLAYHLTHAKRKAIASLAQGNSVVHLYGRDIARIEVTLPDAKTQSDIAHTLRIRQREIELLARLVFQYRRQKAGLMQVLLGTPDRNTP